MEWAVIGIVVAIAIIVITLRTQNHFDNEVRARMHETNVEGLGGPVFVELPNGKKKPCTQLIRGDLVWCITPVGVLKGHVALIKDGIATITCAEYEVTAEANPEYFSVDMAARLRTNRSIWCVTDIRSLHDNFAYKSGQSGIRPLRNSGSVVAWLREDSIFGEFLELMVEELWYHFIYDGFFEPVEYYNELEPAWENGNRDEGLVGITEPAVGQPEPETAVDAEISDSKPELFATPPMEPVQESVAEPEPERYVPEPTQYSPPPVSEPDYSYDSSSDSGGDFGD